MKPLNAHTAEVLINHHIKALRLLEMIKEADNRIRILSAGMKNPSMMLLVKSDCERSIASMEATKNRIENYYINFKKSWE